MGKLIVIATEECPKHKGEFLSVKNLIIKYPKCPKGEGIPFFNYCEKDNKYYNGKKFVSVEEIALEFINQNYNKNYKLSEIEVFTMDELVKQKTKSIPS